MPLLDLSEYTNLLRLGNASSESVYLSGLLVAVENYLLTKYDLNFGTETTTKKRDGGDETMSIFSTKFVRNISQITLKQYGNSDFSEVLIENTDYITSQIVLSPKPIFQIQLLKKSISLPHYLEITGKWSFADTITDDLKWLLLDLLLESLAKFRQKQDSFDNNGKVETSVKLGNATIGYKEPSSNQSQSFSTIIENSSLKTFLDTNYLYL